MQNIWSFPQQRKLLKLCNRCSILEGNFSRIAYLSKTPTEICIFYRATGSPIPKATQNYCMEAINYSNTINVCNLYLFLTIYIYIDMKILRYSFLIPD